MAQRRKTKPRKRQLVKPDDLTLKQQRWIEHYLISGNSTDAARKAGYNGSDAVLGQIGYENLRKLEIKTKIADRIADSKVEANEVIGTLASQMRADMTELLTPGGHLDIQLIRDKRLGHLIKKIKTRRYFDSEAEEMIELTEVELHSPQAAAVQLCKVLGIEREPLKQFDSVLERVRAAILQDMPGANVALVDRITQEEFERAEAIRIG